MIHQVIQPRHAPPELIQVNGCCLRDQCIHAMRSAYDHSYRLNFPVQLAAASKIAGLWPDVCVQMA